METPLVSVCCMTYNHEKYIARALDGMLAQKTNFPYEIIVHDDASTDGTAAIVREYAQKYPDIIRPIFQTENQYSKEPKIIRNFMLPRCRGKYMAECEGDDFWICEDKLQLQVDFMEANPECQMCTHALRSIVADTEELVLENHYMDHDGYLDPGLIIQDVHSPQTATFLYRKTMWETYPEFFQNMGIGDYPKRVFCAVTGGVYYMDKVMSCYRKFTSGSWTNGLTQNTERAKRNLNNRMSFLTQLDGYTNGAYQSYIQVAMDEYRFAYDIRFGKLTDALKMPYFKELSLKHKVKEVFTGRWPKLWYAMVRARNRIAGK